MSELISVVAKAPGDRPYIFDIGRDHESFLKFFGADYQFIPFGDVGVYLFLLENDADESANLWMPRSPVKGKILIAKADPNADRPHGLTATEAARAISMLEEMTP